MAILHVVEFWPQTGLVNALWAEGVDEDAFLRSARGISELYSEGIRAARVEARHSQLRLHCFDHEPGRVEVEVTVFTDPTDGYEMAGVHLPDGVATLSATARAALALDVLHAAALQMAEARGWSPAAFETARAHVVEQGMRYRWTGPEKTAPGRRHIARPIGTITDDGLGRIVVEIRRVTDGTLIGTSVELEIDGTQSAFRHAAGTLRWSERQTVQIKHYHEWHTIKVEELPVLTVRKEGADSGSTIRVLGGYTDRTVPESYTTALDLLTEELQEPRWTRWWSAADEDVLEIWFDLIAERPAGVTPRRSGNKLRVRVDRPLAEILAAPDPIALALDDVTATLAATRKRAGLGPHPELPDLSQVTAMTEEQLRQHAATVGRMQALLDQLADRLPAWLATSLRGDLNQGKTSEAASVLQAQLAHLGIDTTDAERAELDALAANQR